MIEIPASRRHLVTKILFCVASALGLFGATAVYTGSNHSVTAKSFGALIPVTLGFILLIVAMGELWCLIRKTPALRLNEEGLFASSSFGKTKFHPWNQIAKIAIEHRIQRSGRYPNVHSDELVFRNDREVLHRISDARSVLGLNEVVVQLKTLPEAASRLDQTALDFVPKTMTQKFFSAQVLFPVTLALFILYVLWR